MKVMSKEPIVLSESYCSDKVKKQLVKILRALQKAGLPQTTECSPVKRIFALPIPTPLLTNLQSSTSLTRSLLWSGTSSAKEREEIFSPSVLKVFSSLQLFSIPLKIVLDLSCFSSSSSSFIYFFVMYSSFSSEMSVRYL